MLIVHVIDTNLLSYLMIIMTKAKFDQFCERFFEKMRESQMPNNSPQWKKSEKIFYIFNKYDVYVVRQGSKIMLSEKIEL